MQMCVKLHQRHNKYTDFVTQIQICNYICNICTAGGIIYIG